MSVIAFHEKAGRGQVSCLFFRGQDFISLPFCCEIFVLCFLAVVLTFFIAGLLFICASSTSITWERTPHPVGDRPSDPIS